MPTFTFEGLSIAYTVAGTGDPIVFLHNLGGHRGIWAAQTDALAATNTTYALDWFGYGESSIPDDGYTIERHLRLLEAFVTQHGLKELTIVGNCFGSAMALLFARRHPHLVRSLVLVNPLTAATLRPTLTGRAARLLRNVPLGPIVRRIRVPDPIAGLVIREQLGSRGAGAAALRPLRSAWTEPRRLIAPSGILPELPILAELDRFRPGPEFPPITTVWGKKNRILSARAGDRLDKTLCPRSAITVPDCGHLVMIEAPASITQAVESALYPTGTAGERLPKIT